MSGTGARAQWGCGPAWSRISCLLGAVMVLPMMVAAPLAAQGISTQANPTYLFTTPGQKTVTLKVCNTWGLCAQVTKTLTVLDPRPAIQSALVAGASAEVGQLVHLTGTATGQPPLTYTWQILLAGVPVASLPGSSVWWNTLGLPPGLFSARLQVQNASGTATSSDVPVLLTAEQPGNFYTVTPCRVFDSRATLQGPLVSGAAARIISVTNACELPPNARAVVANITAVTPTGTGHATVFPGNYPQPPTSNINFNTGVTRANHAILQLATDGSGTLALTAAVANGGSVHLLVDVSGYFAAQ